MTEPMITCSSCGTGAADIDPTESGYCAACEETSAEQREAVIESAMPMVFGDDKTSFEIVRALWRNGWRVTSRSSHNVAACRACGMAEIDPARAARELERAVYLVQAARRADIERERRHQVRSTVAELRHWIGLSATVFRHVFTASMLLQSCASCVEKVQKQGSKLIHLA
jgi:hypothetical protein